MLLSWSVVLLEFAQCDSNRQDRPEDSPGSKSQLSEKSPLEPLDDEVEEAPLDREVPSKPAEPLPLEDLGIAQSEPSSELGMFLFINILYSIVLKDYRINDFGYGWPYAKI